MFFLRSHYTHPAFQQGARDMWPQAPGIAAWGLMTGVAMVKSGMSVVESLMMALLVFAGSSQLAAIPLIVAAAPRWVILATGFCVNLRFVVFSLHLRPYLMHLPLWQRATHGYLTADLSYVLFTRRFPKPADDAAGRLTQEAYLAGNCFINWCSWVGASVVGVVLANFIPTEWGLGFAGILCLVGILCSLASTRMRVVSAAVAGVAAVAAWALPLKLNIVVAIAVAVLLCLTLEKRPPWDRAERAA
jgi:predicted branched-subunit amino acid permease